MGREMRTKTATIANAAAISDVINKQGFETVVIYTPTAWTDANIGFKVCATPDGTFVILRDAAGVPVQCAVIVVDAAGAHVAPAGVAGARFIKLWSKNTTAATITDNSQGAARTLVVEMTA